MIMMMIVKVQFIIIPKSLDAPIQPYVQEPLVCTATDIEHMRTACKVRNHGIEIDVLVRISYFTHFHRWPPSSCSMPGLCCVWG